VIGTYIFPAEIAVSGNFHHTSGDPFARQVRVRGGRTIPALVVNVEPIGTHRRPNLNLVQLRVEKRFMLPRAHVATVTLNLYNALNGNAVLQQSNTFGNWQQPQGIPIGRSVKVSVQYEF